MEELVSPYLGVLGSSEGVDVHLVMQELTVRLVRDSYIFSIRSIFALIDEICFSFLFSFLRKSTYTTTHAGITISL